MPGVSRARLKVEQAYAEQMWRRCATDPSYFFRTCLFIPVPPQVDKRGRTELNLYDYQQDDLSAMMEEQYLIILKCRQIGISTLVGAYVLWQAIFHPGSVILWISKTDDDAKKAVGMLKVMWQFMPQWAKERAPGRTRDQTGVQEWTFADGMTSRIRTLAPTAGAGAGETATLAIFDEAALPPADVQENVHRSLTPTTDAGGSLWLISTARGGYNRFAKTYRRAVKGESIFKARFHPWMVSRYVNRRAHLLRGCPVCAGTGFNPDTSAGAERYCPRCVDTTRYHAKANEFVEEPWLFASEYPSDAEEAFRESGRPRFSDLLPESACYDEWVRGRLDEGLEFIPSDGGPLRLRADIFAEGVDARRDYVLHVDTAKGLGQDYTVGTVLGWDDDGNPEQLAFWSANTVEEDVAADEMDLLGRFFKGRRRCALLSVERAGGHGPEMITNLTKRLSYPRMYRHKVTGRAGARRGMEYGLPVSWQSKPQIVGRLAKYLLWSQDGAHLQAIDPGLRFELSTFVRGEDGKEHADTGTHDDRVMSMAGAVWILTQETTSGVEEPPEEEAPDNRFKVDEKLLQAMKGEVPPEAREEEIRRQRRSRLMRLRR